MPDMTVGEEITLNKFLVSIEVIHYLFKILYYTSEKKT
jgi:hypothetical protein